MTECIWNEIIIRTNKQVVGPVRHVCDINPLTTEPRSIYVSAARRNPHIAAAVLRGASPAAFKVHHTKTIFKSDGDDLTVHGEEVILGVALVMPVAVAITPLKLIVFSLAGNSDVIIQITNVQDVSRKPHQFAVAVSVQATFFDVTIRFANLHHLRAEAVDDCFCTHD